MESRVCYVLSCSCYSSDNGVSVYWDEHKAFKAMLAELETEIVNLQQEGYTNFESAENDHNALLYVPSTNIYYEWDIVETTIE